MDASIIIPCLNEEPHLYGNVEAIMRIMAATRFSYELILIDEVSEDATRETIARLADMARERGVPCRTVFHERRMGRGATVREGLRLAQGRMAGFLDVDLEIAESYIPHLLSLLDRGEADMAMVRRCYKISLRPQALLRVVLSRGYAAMVEKTLGIPPLDSETGYKFFLMSSMRPVLEECEHDGWFWDTEITALSMMRGRRVVEIPGLFMKNPVKRSTVRIVRDVRDYLRCLRTFAGKRREELLIVKKRRPGFFYRNKKAYSLLMKALYGKGLEERYREAAARIEPGASVADVCCGEGLLWTQRLKGTGARYLGLDLNPPEPDVSDRERFRKFDLWDEAIPEADHVVMFAALCHFHPRTEAVIRKLQAAARKTVIISEPVHNLINPKRPILARMMGFFADPGRGNHVFRYDPESLGAALAPLRDEIVERLDVCGGKETMVVLRGRAGAPAGAA